MTEKKQQQHKKNTNLPTDQHNDWIPLKKKHDRTRKTTTTKNYHNAIWFSLAKKKFIKKNLLLTGRLSQVLTFLKMNAWMIMDRKFSLENFFSNKDER